MPGNQARDTTVQSVTLESGVREKSLLKYLLLASHNKSKIYVNIHP